MIRRLTFCVIFTLLARCQSRFDVDELNYNYYDVSILDIPALLNSVGENGEMTSHETAEKITRLPETFENFTDRFLIGNKQGRLYLCGLPDKINNREVNDRDIEHRRDVLQNLTETNITDTLNSYVKRCLKKTFGWWTYEFCFNDIIYQYHLENDRITDEKLVLGRHDRTHVWNKSEQSTTFVYKKQPVYYSQNYTHGSLCELSSKLRQTEVKFYCDEELFGAELRRVDEPETCRYVIHVYVAGLCKFEAFAPVDKKVEAQGIQCIPTLTPAEMERYEKYKAKNADQSNASKTTMTSSATNEIDEASFPKLNLKQGLPVWDVQHVTFDATNRDVDNKLFAEFFAKEIVNSVLDEGKIAKTLPAEDDSELEKSRDIYSEKTSDVADELNETPAKDSVDDQVDTNTDDSTEAKTFHIQINGDVSDPEKSPTDDSTEEKDGKTKNEAVLRTLAAALRRIIAEMEKTENELVETSKQLEIKTNQVKSLLEKHRGQYSSKFSTNQNEDHVTTARKSNPFEAFRRKNAKSDKSPPPVLSTNQKIYEEKVGSRFTTETSQSESTTTKSDQSELTSDTDTVTGLSTNRRKKDLQDLEDDVREQTTKLENQILSTLDNDIKKVQKVRVEIATAYYDEERNEMRVLSTGSGGDSKHVTNLLSYLLGNGEQQKEEKRHAKLEQNYQFDFEDEEFDDVIGKQQDDFIGRQNDVIAKEIDDAVAKETAGVIDRQNYVVGQRDDVSANKNDANDKKKDENHSPSHTEL